MCCKLGAKWRLCVLLTAEFAVNKTPVRRIGDNPYVQGLDYESIYTYI